jgi:hypothetical protein
MTPRFLPVADRALMVDFAATLDPAAHRAVLSLDRALPRSPFPASPKPCPPLSPFWSPLTRC